MNEAVIHDEGSIARITERLERVEAHLEIGQLPVRYAMAIDARDLDALVACFVPDVPAGRWGTGRDSLRQFFDRRLRDFYRTIHQICGQTIELVDSTNATGQTYCRAEHEDRGRWVVMAICYSDTFEQVDGEWFFSRRKEQHWYSSDVLERPTGPNFQRWPGNEKKQVALPHAWPTWNEFWSASESTHVATLTSEV